MKKDGIEIVAAIDVGSNSIRMAIAEIRPDGTMYLLEDLNKPTDIGRDTFSTGKIEVETVYEVCDILKGFTNLMKDYRIRNYRAVSTSGMREALNKQYVLEQIRIRTGLVVDIISSSEERFYIYKAISDIISREIFKEGTLIVDIGSGGVEISAYTNNCLNFTQNVNVGALRLTEMLSDIANKTLDYPSAIEEYIESKIYSLRPIIKKLHINNFIALGGEIKFLSGDYIKKRDFLKAYDAIKNMDTEKIKAIYKLPVERADLFLPSIVTFNTFLKMTDAETIHTPHASLRFGLLEDMVDERFDTERKRNFLKDIENSVWNIAKKYNIDEKHTSFVKELSLFTFDSTLKIHKMGERERLYLLVASILHDIGKYININNHDIECYNIIKNENLMGFSKREMDIIANIARFHSHRCPDPSIVSYGDLYYKDKLRVAKLCAILKISEALDISHKQKVNKFEIMISGQEIIFKFKSNYDTILEEWSLNKSAAFFEEVMGYRPIIKRKG